jgi:succinate dehydrogenase / fumarate reductase iron-sulfur subunit
MADYIFKIFRFNPQKDRRPFYQLYTLGVKPDASVLDCLNQIKWHSDGTLGFRRSCRSGICGSCAVNVNGKKMLACETKISDLKKKRIVIKPLPHFVIIKDLVVDLDPFFDGIKAVKPYRILKDEARNEKETFQAEKDRDKLDGRYECIHCGACTSACPSFWYDNKYLGPAALLKAGRYITDSRDCAKKERYTLIDGKDGIWSCHTIFNCVEACPKNLNPTEVIQQLKKAVIKDKLGR